MDGYRRLLLAIFRPARGRVEQTKAIKQTAKQDAKRVAAEKRAEKTLETRIAALRNYSGKYVAVLAGQITKQIVERTYGKLPRGACVHHINGDPRDNHPGNLLVCTKSYHMWLHTEMSRRYAQEHF